MIPTRCFIAVLGGFALGAALAAPLSAADPKAGAELATQCAACHGEAGVSTDAKYPNLAAQKDAYVKAQLEAFRSGKRKNDLMNAIAASLSDADIENLAAHFAGLPGADPGAAAQNVSGLDGALPGFPADFEKTFTQYQRIDFEKRKQVRFYRANDVALAAAKAGGPFPEGAYLFVEIFGAKADADGKLVKGADGKLVPTERKAFTAMEKRAGWGNDVPEVLRNGDWRYAVFSVEGKHKAGLNEGPCLACHKPLTDTDYTFTYEKLQEFAKAN
ncbi:MAG: cytochrome P460 family protein [Alphaproteobacteria bacterium]|nr:cytochrome P460 family protein [Alphaproteobacteria bacterium]